MTSRSTRSGHLTAQSRPLTPLFPSTLSTNCHSHTLNQVTCLPLPSSCLKFGISTLGFFPAAAAAKLLQSCPTLCDPIDGSPTGSSVCGIFQARVLEWECHRLLWVFSLFLPISPVPPDTLFHPSSSPVPSSARLRHQCFLSFSSLLPLYFSSVTPLRLFSLPSLPPELSPLH